MEHFISKKQLTIAVDFDGTIVEHKYPEIGRERPFAIQTLKMLASDGHKIILWTVRQGNLLDDAVEWCHNKGFDFYAVNCDYPGEEIEKTTTKRKLVADIFIDDRQIGGLPDWGTIYQLITKNKSLVEYINEALSAERNQKPALKKHWWNRI